MKKILLGTIIFLFFMGSLFSDQSIFDENLCAPNEDIVCSFKMKNSTKTLSILIAKDYSYIVYRFGTKDNVELEFPQSKIDSWKKFTLYADSYFRLGVNYRLSFINCNTRYDILDESFSDGRYDNHKVGVRIINNGTNTQTTLEGVYESKIGDLDFLDKRMYLDQSRYSNFRMLEVIDIWHE